MVQDKFSDKMPEVLLVPKPRRIRIICTLPVRVYGLFDTVTGTQVKDFVKCDGKQIEFDTLNPNMHYDVGVIENMGDEKPQFTIIWNNRMRDDTEEILKNSNGLPIEYPHIYEVKFNDSNSKNVYDLVDNEGETVGQVVKLSPQDDKPYIRYVHSFKMKDDTIK